MQLVGGFRLKLRGVVAVVRASRTMVGEKEQDEYRKDETLRRWWLTRL